jgi:predicted CXXCH cytochrome family protein
MEQTAHRNPTYSPWLAGLIVWLVTMILTVGIVLAAPLNQEADQIPHHDDKDCKDCHLNITSSWSRSPHAHAFDDPVFQERWKGLGNPGDCLLCHTTNYQAATGVFSAEGISCEACHGQVRADHPPAMVPIMGDAEYCGACHTTTLHEWRLTGHAASGVGCMSCHDPHSQLPLFEDPDNLCINCHQEDMGAYLEDVHIQKGIGCVDCHALVIPPDPVPIDGIVPTGHTFTITPATCVACHTDTLHAGFSLPGYERGAREANNENQSSDLEGNVDELIGFRRPNAENGLSAEQRIQALEAALASKTIGTIFQGGVIGLVLGGSTAWFIAHNVRRSRILGKKEDEEKQEKSDG